MPNWCNNTVRISHEDPAKIAALAEAINRGDFCKFVIPIPDELTDTTAPNRDNPEALIEATGYADWYDFCVNEWGTKWDIEPYDTIQVEANSIYFGFDSAWSPPVGVYDKLYEDGYVVDATYNEPGMTYAGRYYNGFDECFDYSGCDSTNVAEMIGEDLDEIYGISESMAEWEADEAEGA